MGADVIEIEVEADVAIEIAVARVAGITLMFAPDLAGGIVVAAKGGHAPGCINRRVGAVARAGLGMQNAVRIENEPADIGLLQKIFHAAQVRAFGQPDAARRPAETAHIMFARSEDLTADGLRVVGHQRQQPMGGGGGDDLQQAGVLKLFKRADEIALMAAPGLPGEGELLVVHPRQIAVGAVPVRPVNLLFRQLNQAVQMPGVTFAEQGVQQHGAERRREGQGQAGFQQVALPAVEHVDQRQVGFRDGFKQPALLEKFLMFRVPYKRQVRMEDQ